MVLFVFKFFYTQLVWHQSSIRNKGSSNFQLVSGEMISSIADELPQEKESKTYDLFVKGDKMIIPRYDERKVLVYQLA